MTTYTVYHIKTRIPFELESETAAAAVIRAINSIENPIDWEFDGLPLCEWFEAARLTLPPLRKV